MKAAGIELKIDNGAPGVLGPQLQRGDFDVELLNYGKNEFGNVTQFRPGNKWGYDNPRPNQLIVQSNTELDDAKRRATLEQADRILWDDLPVVPLYHEPTPLAVARRLCQRGAQPKRRALLERRAVGPQGTCLTFGRTAATLAFVRCACVNGPSTPRVGFTPTGYDR